MEEEESVCSLSASPPSVTSEGFIQPVHPWPDTQTPVDKSGHKFVPVGGQGADVGEDVCRWGAPPPAGAQPSGG